MTLVRGARMITSANQSGLTYVGGAFDLEVFDPAAFDCGVETFAVRLPGGNVRSLAEIFANVHAMWQSILTR
jgi:hypothetical protein